MSIFVKNVDWSQTENEIILNVPINRKKSIDDVVIAEKFLKVNVHPYFYEVFFEHPISVDQSTCKILESHFKFRLKKTNNKWWQSLGRTAKPTPDSNDDTISIEQRKEIFSEYEVSCKEEIAKQRKEQARLKQSEIDKQIERASRIREKIDETENNLKKNQIDIQEESSGVVVETVANEPKVKDKPKAIENDHKPLPPIRSCGKIGVNLSSRQFVTPKRESLEQVEREWCAKQHEITVNRIGFCDKDLNDDEKDLSWLLQKGRLFLEKKNFLAAASAFNCGLKVSNDSPDLFLGRARAQFGLKHYKQCAEDSSDALERFKPAVDSNLLGRIHCFWLRGKSLMALKLMEHGNRELHMAFQLDPKNFDRNQQHFMKDSSETQGN